MLEEMRASGLLYTDPSDLVAMATTPAEAVKMAEKLVAEERAKPGKNADTAMAKGNRQASYVWSLRAAAGVGCVAVSTEHEP